MGNDGNGGLQKIHVERKLCHCIDGKGKTSNSIKRVESIFKFVIKNEEIGSTKRDEHGGNGHKQ